jgi:ribosomal protein S18 acetylase RimI-like enzyme
MMDGTGETFLDLVSVEFSLPSVAEFNHLRQLVGWRLMTAEATQNALQNSLISCCARRGGELVGYGRFVGDGSMYFYLQDVMVHPEHQGKGIGNKLMNKLEGWLKEQMQYGSTGVYWLLKAKRTFICGMVTMYVLV